MTLSAERPPLWECPWCGATYTDAEAKQQHRKCWRHPGYTHPETGAGVPLEMVAE